MSSQRTGRQGANHSTAAPPRRQARRLPALYKSQILREYDSLDRAGRSELLRREKLRPSQISQWRKQSGKAALQALTREPGSQPVRSIHMSDSLWNELAEGGARLDPAMSPERVIRALTSYWVGRTDRIPPRPVDRTATQPQR